MRLKSALGESMSIPQDLKFTRDHEWARTEADGSITVGITDFAQDQLGDIVFVELPDKGSTVGQFDAFGVVESTKSVSDLISPIGGRVIAVNNDLDGRPEVVNDDAYGEGWMIRVQPDNESELDDLLSASDYETFLGSLDED
jgi:glycine cleavage system H protein